VYERHRVPIVKNCLTRVCIGQRTLVDSSSNRHGEFEYYDPRAAAEFLKMPRHTTRLEQDVDGI
jgi:hypothetical protein